MYVDSVSDQTETVDVLDFTCGKWNYHEVEKLDEKSQPAILHALTIRHVGRASLHHRKENIKPTMAKANVSYSEKDGWKGEVSVTIDFNPSDNSDKDSSSGNSDNSNQGTAGDVNSQDSDQKNG